MTDMPQDLDHTFTAPIGVTVKGDLWSCVEMPGSADFFATRNSVRVDLTVDELVIDSVGLMVTGTGGHMLSLSAKVRARLGKQLGDEVTVHLSRRIR